LNTDSPKTAPLSLVVAAFATVYLVWGSTYLAIRFAIETLPPFIMAGLRFSIAGLILLAIVRRREPIALTGWHWFKAGLTGSLMLIGGNALVCWSEQYVASGPAALVIATVPLWLVVLDWLVFGGARPTWRIVAGLVIGLFGVFILIGPSVFVGGEAIDTIGGLALLAACVFWAIGSLYSRRAKLPGSPFLATAAQMTIAGALLLVIGALAGEGAALDLDRVSTKSVLALGYLIVFGAILGLTAYVWLLSVTTPARVSTYAYVNPVVALLLGYGLANEPLSSRVLLATSVILGAVILITTSRAKPSAAPKGVDEPSPDTGELDVADPVAQPRTGVLAMPPTADEETPRMSCTGVSR
jgi:drug/metabolite transporter (DMT)-like permease